MVLRFLDFTYCGFAIDTRNLDISIDLSRKLDMRRCISHHDRVGLTAIAKIDSKDAFSTKYVRHVGQVFGQWLRRCDKATWNTGEVKC